MPMFYTPVAPLVLGVWSVIWGGVTPPLRSFLWIEFPKCSFNLLSVPVFDGV